MRLLLKNLTIENFKGIKKMSIDFSLLIFICGANATGKTTVFDALCWLLFGKDSLDREKFEIRELDQNGNKVHNTEISVTGTFMKDDAEIVFKRTQKENWVKKRGSDAPTLQGNVNSMEINGYPMSDSEYKEKVAEIISEDMFKILTNPMHFASLPWKDQRNLLMRFVESMSDTERAKSYGGEFESLIPDLDFAGSTDDIQKKYSRAIKELKEKQTEIPVRIDELSKTKSDVDVSKLSEQKKDIEYRISEIGEKMSSSSVDTSELQARISALKGEMNAYVSKAKKDLQDKAEALWEQIRALEHTEEDKRLSIHSAKQEIKWKESDRKAVFDHTTQIREKYEEAKSRKFPENEWRFNESETVCRLCGQPLPEDKIEQIKADFAERKSKAKTDFANQRNIDLETLKRKGEEGNEQYKGLGKAIEGLKERINTLEAEMESVKNDRTKLEERLAEINIKMEDIANDPEYLEKVSVLNDAIAELESTREGASDISPLKAERDELQADLEGVIEQIALSQKDSDIDKRIGELQAEQKEVAQKVADNEKMLNLLERFVRQKMEDVSESINSKFDIVGFKLFSEQINGGIKECCEMTVNGVPYASLNNGHKIVGGLDVIKALQGLLGVETPIWIDNAESVNDYNIPKINSQMVLLKVTDDKSLEIRR